MGGAVDGCMEGWIGGWGGVSGWVDGWVWAGGLVGEWARKAQLAFADIFPISRIPLLLLPVASMSGNRALLMAQLYNAW